MSHRQPPGNNFTTIVKQSVQRVTTASSTRGPLIQQTFPRYRLKWENLKAFLEGRFPKDKYPELPFHERMINNDQYVFMTPEPLTECHGRGFKDPDIPKQDDRAQIYLLLDEDPHLQQDRQQSVEP